MPSLKHQPPHRVRPRAGSKNHARRLDPASQASCVVSSRRNCSNGQYQSQIKLQNLNRHYDSNQQYSITAVSDGGGAVVECYAYSAYGKVTSADSSGSQISNSEISNRYTYTGREWDEGLSLYHYRARMYKAVGGRFVSRDPIGVTGSRFGLYEYVSGRPSLAVDPSGLYGGWGGNTYISPSPEPAFLPRYWTGGGSPLDISGSSVLARWMAKSLELDAGKYLLTSIWLDAAIRNDRKCGSATFSGSTTQTIGPGNGRGIPDAITDPIYILNDSTVTANYNCTVDVQCEDCCGEDLPRKTTIVCSVDFTFFDRFANPLDWHTPTPVPPWIRVGDKDYDYESETCRKECISKCLFKNSKWCKKRCESLCPNTELLFAKPYDIKGNWRHSFTKTMDHPPCPW